MDVTGGGIVEEEAVVGMVEAEAVTMVGRMEGMDIARRLHLRQ